MKLAYTLLAALFLAAATPGCGSSIEDICSEGCDCEGCSDEEYEDCVDDFEDAERAADNEGCLDQFDSYIDCLADELECQSGDVDIDGCYPEADDLGDCLN